MLQKIIFCLLFSSILQINEGMTSSSSSTKISKALLTRFQLNEKSKVTILVSMAAKKPIENILASVATTHWSSVGKRSTFSNSRDLKLNSIVEALKIEANTVQNDLLSFLTSQKELDGVQVTFHQLWITNQVIITGADWSLIEKLGDRSDISEIFEEKIIPFEQPPINFTHQVTSSSDDPEVQWGVSAINAPKVWSEFGNMGQNVVVGSIDTGVRSSHLALNDNFRATYGWYDGLGWTNSGQSPQIHPFDPHGHGTHTTGTIVGTTRGIGVAPKAMWVACRACDTDGCTEPALLSCGQWMTCPMLADGTKSNCSMAPHLVSNSWGGLPGLDTFYRDVVKTWHAAGIIPVFSIGNAGQYGCETTGSPGNYEEVIGVGSVTSANLVSPFSSLGPVRNSMGLKVTKPDIVAPGSDVLSAHNGHDTQYVVMSGTSMACPHVSGLVALMLSQNPRLTYEEIKDRLQNGTIPTSGTSGKNCGGNLESEYPNNHAGHGRIDAYKTLTNSALPVLNSIYLISILLIIVTFFYGKK